MTRLLSEIQGRIAGAIMVAGLVVALGIGLVPFVAAAADHASSCQNGVCVCTEGELPQGNGEDLQINTGTCIAKHENSPFNFHNVNIYGGGQLKFADDGDIDFYAESILIENQGIMTAGAPSQAGAYQSRLTIHLWGKATDLGIQCQSTTLPKGGPCGIPSALWTANPDVALHMNMGGGSQPTKAKNAPCKSIPGYSQFLPKDDCFYQYEIQDPQDQQANRQAFFGHKVLAVSFGGTLQLFGSKGTTYLTGMGTCDPTNPTNECNPANTGSSWRRLTSVSADNKTLTLSNLQNPVNWKAGDHVVVTTTDYLPSHSEERILASDATNNQLVLTAALTYLHNANVYPIPSTVPLTIGPDNDPNVPDINRAVDTRAAVALLTRNIQIVSAGDTATDPFTEKPGNYYGGHTIIRQGFSSYQVQGVEFYLLGQGGQKGRYPVHFHMDRRTPQQTDPTQGALNFLKDSSIHESMTRWVTIHATQGMYVARNVGFRSIGHGFYFEDATEIDNKLYANIGIMARAAIQNVQNPRMVPGILADTKTDGTDGDFMPYRSDFNHPTTFWIMNGWNDFEYNMAVGAATCGACYWWLPAGNSGPSQYEFWDGYASQGIYDPQGNGNCAPVGNPPKTVCQGNLAQSGFTPLKKFVGNSCVAAMSSFQTVGTTNECIGVFAQGSGGLAAVPSTAPKEPSNVTLFNIYYPTLTSAHNATICTGADDPTMSVQCGQTQGVNAPGCSNTGPDFCAATVLDRYHTSFNWAETNFSAVWLRPKWYLVSNSAITDVQTGGINFVTGGGYTRSDIPQGYWSLMRKSVLVGHTQAQGSGGNPFAFDSGPFNPTTATQYNLKCDTQDPNRCQSATEGVTFLLPPFPGQRLFNIYDGPAFQEGNAYLDITTTRISDCNPNSNGNCGMTQFPLARNKGVLIDKSSAQCYLPNAAVAWKQPNGFYYPPSFISENLWFDNVDIRHFVVEPFFVNSPQDPNNPFVQSQSQIQARYCTYTAPDPSGNGTTFTGFNHIDRQTVLNDADGSLTGLLANDSTDPTMPTKPSISINEDDYFNGPTITPECLSDKGVTPNNPNNRVYTARTSPYEWLTAGIIADCAIQTGPFTNLQQCQDAQNRVQWSNDCTTSSCRGVPLFREDLTDAEKGTQPSIRMMGQALSQRSTLSLNHGAYYIDTSQGCNSQGACPVCTPNQSGTDCMYCLPGTSDCWTNGNDIDPKPWHPSIFLGGHTYYVYFLYAKPSTKQTYDIYVGKNEAGKYTVTPVLANLPSGAFEFTPMSGGTWLTPPPAYNAATGTVRVTVDLSGETSVFDNSKSAFCQPRSFCEVKGSGGTATCGCTPGSQCTDDSVCTWAQRELDCPQDPNDPNKMGCFGFSITMPADFQAPPIPMRPDPSLFQPFNTDPYFQKGIVTFSTQVAPSGGDCVYTSPPAE